MIWALALGLIAGSFINVVIYRVPRKLGIVFGRSQCPHCERSLFWYDMIPVISFFFLGGRCRFCRKPISILYPLVEIISGLIFLYFYSSLGLNMQALFYVFIAEVLLILFFTDLEHMILPDAVIIAGFIGAIILRPSLLSLNHIMAAIFFLALFFLVWFLSKGKWLGLGDAKFMALIGFIFGLWSASIVLYTAVIIGTVVGILVLVAKRGNMKTHLPFGSFLSVACGYYLLFGFGILESTKLNLISRLFNGF